MINVIPIFEGQGIGAMFVDDKWQLFSSYSIVIHWYKLNYYEREKVGGS
jgi:hypothetical protein